MSLWVGKAGDLAVDSRLIVDKYVKDPGLKFDEKATFALEKMKDMKAQISSKNSEIEEMKNKLGESKNSNANISEKMSKLLEHEQELQTQKAALIEKTVIAQSRYESLWSSLQSFADCSVFDNLGTGELSDMESCLF